DQRRGRGVEFQTGRGAGERDPQLQVQLVQVHQVRAGLQLHLVEAARPEEFPAVSGHGIPMLEWARDSSTGPGPRKVAGMSVSVAPVAASGQRGNLHAGARVTRWRATGPPLPWRPA